MASGDIETGKSTNRANALYPGMSENPQLRWAFIRKVYAIIVMQLLLTVAIASVVVFVHAIPRFVLHTGPGIAILVTSFVLSLILLFPLRAYRKAHPWNLVLLALFTVSIAFTVGLSCSFAKGRVILEAVILTSIVVVTLTLYTFWAAKKGYDFSFLGPFLFASLLVLLVFGAIQIFLPLGKLSSTIYSCIVAIIFCGFIVYDTDELIKRYSYDEYVWASVSLYLDIINLFVNILAASEG